MARDESTGEFRIGAVHFDPKSRSISVGKRVAFLDSRASLIFAALCDRFGNRVSKDELLALAWPDRLVHENSVAKAISKLRAALSGSDLEIAASYGVGYVLREAGDASGGSSVSKSDHAVDDSLKAPVRVSRGAVAASVAALLAVAGGAVVLGTDRAEPTDAAVRRAPPVMHDLPDAFGTILWVDDNPRNNELEVADFKRRRIAVHLAESTDDAIKLMEMNAYRLVVSDLGRGDDRLAGLKMIETMRARSIDVPVIIYTVRPKNPAGQAAQRRLVADAGAHDLALTPAEVRSKVLGAFASANPKAG